jgi:hypothetical protein
MLAQYLDLTKEFNENQGTIYIETSNYDYCIVQVVGTSDGFTIVQSTIDSGAIEGVTDGSIITATNWSDIAGINLSDLSIVTGSSNIFYNGLIKFDVVGRYIKMKNGGTASKVLVMLSKIS